MKTPLEVKGDFAKLLEQARNMQTALKRAFREADDSLPKDQRSSDELVKCLIALDSLECALIRAKSKVQAED